MNNLSSVPNSKLENLSSFLFRFVMILFLMSCWCFFIVVQLQLSHCPHPITAPCSLLLSGREDSLMDRGQASLWLRCRSQWFLCRAVAPTAVDSCICRRLDPSMSSSFAYAVNQLLPCHLARASPPANVTVGVGVYFERLCNPRASLITLWPKMGLMHRLTGFLGHERKWRWEDGFPWGCEALRPAAQESGRLAGTGTGDIYSWHSPKLTAKGPKWQQRACVLSLMWPKWPRPFDWLIADVDIVLSSIFMNA